MATCKKKLIHMCLCLIFVRFDVCVCVYNIKLQHVYFAHGIVFQLYYNVTGLESRYNAELLFC